MSEQFKCEIRKMFNNCPKPSGWFGCFAYNRERGKIKVTGTTPFIPHEGMIMKIDADYDDKDDSYSIINASPYTKTEKALVNYLSGQNFPGIGFIIAQKLYDKFGDDTLTIIKDNPTMAKQSCNLSDKQLEVLTKGTANREHSLRQKFPILTDIVAKKLTDTYEKPEIIIAINPYDIAKQIDCFTFDIADEIAISYLHWAIDKPVRIKAHIEHTTIKQLQSTGDNYINLSNDKEFMIYKERLEQNLRIHYNNTVFGQILMNESTCSNHVIYIRKYNGCFHLYSKDSWKANGDIQCAVTAIANSNSNADKIMMRHGININKTLATISKHYKMETGYNISQEQLTAIHNSMSNKLSVITGGPGCGKTATIQNICSFWKQINQSEPMLFAPTGRAAANMKNYTGITAHTVAKLKIMLPFIKESIQNDQYKPLKKLPLTKQGLAIIDECSMIGTEDMAIILYAFLVLFDMQVILVGDKNQLPSISYGKPFADIIQSNKVMVSYLTTCFRAEIKLISDNCNKILTGDTHLQWSPDFLFLNMNDEEKMAQTLMQTYLSAIRTEPIENVALLCGIKKGIAGTINMNIQLQNYLNPENPYAQSYTDKIKARPYIEDLGYVIQETYFGEGKENWTRLRIGDRIMCAKNNYEVTAFLYDNNDIHTIPIDKDKSGIVNGDTGKIICYYPFIDKDHPAELVIKLDDDRIFFLELSKESLSDIKLTLAYAMTFHKTQGCEYSHVFISIQNTLRYIPNNFANQNMLYTGVSRAKKSVMLMGSEENLYSFIQTPLLERNSTLAQEL